MRQAGACERTLAGIRSFLELGIPVDVHCAIGDHNISELEHFIEWCGDLGIASLTFFTLIPAKKEARFGKKMSITKEQLRLRLDRYLEAAPLPIRTIGLVPFDASECVMGESIQGLNARLEWRPCLLARWDVETRQWLPGCF